jgi:hypothetical protein
VASGRVQIVRFIWISRTIWTIRTRWMLPRCCHPDWETFVFPRSGSRSAGGRAERRSSVRAPERLPVRTKPHRVAATRSHAARRRRAVHLRPFRLRAGDPDQRAVPRNAHASDPRSLSSARWPRFAIDGSAGPPVRAIAELKAEHMWRVQVIADRVASIVNHVRDARRATSALAQVLNTAARARP